MKTLVLLLAMTDIPLQTAGQTSAPVCVDFCVSMSWKQYSIDAWQDRTGRWHTGLAVIV